ncbi:uncharacterized protein PRCAT00006045001 [Priceomyces carsonii]|uniref:uncharacterized protein n=1 Tax=Priceomyces carsonii TaxID=28549 RepID=UPI002EDA0CB5|nr:unnamed protein product [Priceomyces carsonii]
MSRRQFGVANTTILAIDPDYEIVKSSNMINYIKGDLFSHRVLKAGIVSILAHACNCRGSWGAGVAAIFQRKFPSTYEKHYKYCKEHSSNPAGLLGTTQLIPSSPSDAGNKNGENNVYVACLFTSDFAGAKKLGPQDIVRHTDAAMRDLIHQISAFEANNVEFERNDAGQIIVNMPKINAGLFAVPWSESEKVLLKYDTLQINIYVID